MVSRNRTGLIQQVKLPRQGIKNKRSSYDLAVGQIPGYGTLSHKNIDYKIEKGSEIEEIKTEDTNFLLLDILLLLYSIFYSFSFLLITFFYKSP